MFPKNNKLSLGFIQIFSFQAQSFISDLFNETKYHALLFVSFEFWLERQLECCDGGSFAPEMYALESNDLSELRFTQMI